MIYDGIDACFGVGGVELGQEQLEWFDGEESVVFEGMEGAGEGYGWGRCGVGAEGCVKVGGQSWMGDQMMMMM